MKVISIDPGYERLGIAVLEDNTLIHSECFQTSKELPFHDRLHLVGKRVGEVIQTYSPDSLAIETLFFNNNKKSAMAVSEARGAIIFQAKHFGLDVYEYSPSQIKIAVTGYGHSPKDQIIFMVPKLITVEKEIKFDDEYDAIAVGLTCIASEKR
jgi:crossover junction endodeoxyribonuclease RuvC